MAEKLLLRSKVQFKDPHGGGSQLSLTPVPEAQMASSDPMGTIYTHADKSLTYKMN